MPSYQNSVPYNALSSEQQNVLKNFIINTSQAIMRMDSVKRETLIRYCYDMLKNELQMIALIEFDCLSYDVFLYQMALAAASVDRSFPKKERKGIEEVQRVIGLKARTYPDNIVKENIRNLNAVKFDLVDVSRRLSPSTRGIYLTFVALIASYDFDISTSELDVMLHILAP